jgi:hypothetical protein
MSYVKVDDAVAVLNELQQKLGQAPKTPAPEGK